MTYDKYRVGLAQSTPPTICIKENSGRALLTIKPDGTVEGEIEDASEAARLFVESLRGHLPKPTQSDALREENERLREHLISALDTLKDAEVCDDNCGPYNEARAALQEQSK